MPIVGIGIDVEQITKTHQSISRYGRSWLNRQFTDFEIDRAVLVHSEATYFTMVFAAKEAVSKALGNGIDDDLTLLSIEISCEGLANWSVSFLNAGKLFVDKLGIEKVHLTVATFNDHVIATAIAEGKS